MNMTLSRSAKRGLACLGASLSHRVVATIRCLALLGTVAIGSIGEAAEAWHSPTVRQVYPQADGSFVLVFNSDGSACPNGSSPKYHYVVVGQNGVTAEDIKSLLAVSLSAAAQGKTIQVAFDNATSL